MPEINFHYGINNSLKLEYGPHNIITSQTAEELFLSKEIDGLLLLSASNNSPKDFYYFKEQHMLAVPIRESYKYFMNFGEQIKSLCLYFYRISDFQTPSVHIAKLNGRVCGAKRPHSVSERSASSLLE